MANKDETQACYNYRLDFYPTKGKVSDFQKLREYYDNANKAADVWTEAFLNLCGGITPDKLANARYSTASVREETDEAKGKKTKNKKGKKNKSPVKKFDAGKEFPDGVILFFHWFTIEDGPGQSEFVIKPQDIYPAFKSYCAEHKVKPLDARWEEVLKKTAFAFDPDRQRTWIDRVQHTNSSSRKPDSPRQPPTPFSTTRRSRSSKSLRTPPNTAAVS